jgi:hypothetical protein
VAVGLDGRGQGQDGESSGEHLDGLCVRARLLLKRVMRWVSSLSLARRKESVVGGDSGVLYRDSGVDQGERETSIGII